MGWDRNQMVARAVRELQDGRYANLASASRRWWRTTSRGREVTLQSENGMLGIALSYEGEEDPDLINAGKQTATALPQTSFFDSAGKLPMIRRQDRDGDPGRDGVAENGDLANWMIPGKLVKGMGAMDLVAGKPAAWWW